MITCLMVVATLYGLDCLAYLFRCCKDKVKNATLYGQVMCIGKFHDSRLCWFTMA